MVAPYSLFTFARSRSRAAFAGLVTASVLSLAACGGSTPNANAPSDPPPDPKGNQASPKDPPMTDVETKGWEKIRDDDGVQVFSKEVEGSPLIAFRGIAIIQAPIIRVASVLVDVHRTPEWVDSVEEAKILKRISKTEAITYSHLGTPFILADREFVNHAKITVGPGRQAKFSIQSTQSELAPKTDYVRGKLMHSGFRLWELGPRRTRIMCEMHADPMGSVPKWLVNQFQKGWAYKTIQSLRKQVRRKDVKDNREILEVLKQKGWFDGKGGPPPVTSEPMPKTATAPKAAEKK